MDKTDEIIDELRKFSEMIEEDIYQTISKENAIRIIAYINKLEDENLLLKFLATKEININIGGVKDEGKGI